MSYALVVIIFSGWNGAVAGSQAILNAPTKEACEMARSALLGLPQPGYDPKFLLCLPGTAPAIGQR